MMKNKTCSNIDLIRYFIVLFPHYLKKIKNFFLKQSKFNFSAVPATINTDLYIKAARELKINIDEIEKKIYRLNYKDKIVWLANNRKNSIDNVFSYWVCADKFLTYEILKKYGISNLVLYKKYCLNTIDRARHDFLKNNGQSVVVKPCYGTSSGSGITVNIKSIKEFNKAVYNALLFDTNFLVEDYIQGDNYRLLFYKSHFISAIKRNPAYVIGNGKQNLKTLIEEENHRRQSKTNTHSFFPIVIDNELKHLLASNKISLKYIPKDGEKIILKYVSNFRSGGNVEEVSDCINHKIVDICESTVRLLNLSIAGVDIISKDISKNKNEVSFYINEINSSPGLFMHYKVINNSKKREVAKLILKHAFNIDD